MNNNCPTILLSVALLVSGRVAPESRAGNRVELPTGSWKERWKPPPNLALAGDRFISHSTWNWIEDAMANLDCNKVCAWTPDDYQVSKVLQESFFNGLDAQHTAQGVTVDNLRLNGKPVNRAADANLSVRQYVSGVRFGQAAK